MKQGRSKDYLKGTRRYRWSGEIPMDKLLRSRVGQNWDSIHQEFSKEFKHGTRAGNMFFNSLDSEVATKCWKGADSGTIYDSRGVEVHGWYVHPLSNCLQFKTTPVRKKEPKPLTNIPLADGTRLEKEFGIWYHTRYDPFSYETESQFFKRQLNARELKKYSIHNDSPDNQLKAKEEQKKNNELAKLSFWPY